MTLKKKKKNHNQKYCDCYSQEFDFIQASRSGDNYALCFVCNAGIIINHGARSDIINRALKKTQNKTEKLRNL